MRHLAPLILILFLILPISAAAQTGCLACTIVNGDMSCENSPDSLFGGSECWVKTRLVCPQGSQVPAQAADKSECAAIVLCTTNADCVEGLPLATTEPFRAEPIREQRQQAVYPWQQEIARVDPTLGLLVRGLDPDQHRLGGLGSLRLERPDAEPLVFSYEGEIVRQGDAMTLTVRFEGHPTVDSFELHLWKSGAEGELLRFSTEGTLDVHSFTF